MKHTEKLNQVHSLINSYSHIGPIKTACLLLQDAIATDPAPKLLEVLKQLAKEHQDLLNEHHGLYPMGCIDYVFKAIVKAEGGE